MPPTGELMFESIVTSKARIKLLLKFFLNPEVKAYLRELSSEFGGSSNSVRVELNHLVNARLLKIEKNGRNKYYSANIDHPLYPEIHSISRKMTGLDQIYEWLSHIGDLDAAYVTGDYARGIDSGVIDLILIGNLEKEHLNELLSKTEELINRRIRPLILKKAELHKMDGKLLKKEKLLLWGEDVTSSVIARSATTRQSPENAVIARSAGTKQSSEVVE